MRNKPGLRLVAVTKRPVFHSELGNFFRAVRTAKGLGFRQAVTIAQAKGLTALTKQALFGLEKGQTKNASPDVLRAVAALYDVEYPWIVANYIGHRYGVVPGSDIGWDLLRMTQDIEKSAAAIHGEFYTSPEERALVEMWRKISHRSRESLWSLLNDLQPKQAKSKRKRSA